METAKKSMGSGRAGKERGGKKKEGKGLEKSEWRQGIVMERKEMDGWKRGDDTDEGEVN